MSSVRKPLPLRYRSLWVFLFLCFAGCFFSFASATEHLEIDNVKLRLIESEKFSRISEYFTGEENTGRRLFLRSEPSERGGLYFITRLSENVKKLPAQVKVCVDFFETGSAVMQHYQFELPERRKNTNRIFIGITGDERLEKGLPVAWRIYFTDSNGSLYAERKSYLWEMPESKPSDPAR